MKKMIAFVLAVLVLTCCLAGCGGSAPDLTGRWESVYYYDSESVLAELEGLEFYEEEIALLDTGAMGFCDVLLLNEDLTYSISNDAAKSRAMVEEYYRNAFAIFFENRQQLQELYGEDFASMSEAEFYQFYADLYGAADYDALINMIVGSVEDYAYLEENSENGTYRVSLNRIFFTIAGTTNEEFVTITMNDDGSMDMKFNDNTVHYTKAE